jgi:hypothetical protein
VTGNPEVIGSPVGLVSTNVLMGIESRIVGNLKTNDRSPLNSSSAPQLVEESWLGRCIGGIVKIAQANAN